MLKQFLRFKLIMILGFCLAFFNPGAFAQNHDRQDHRGDDRENVQKNPGVQDSSHGQRESRRGNHYYHDGRWFSRGWFGLGVPVSVMPAGVIIDSIPPNYTVVVIRGNTYYFGDNMYFSQLPQGGYTVVSVHI